MGLDMYFFKKTYVKNWDHAPERKHEVSVKLNGEKHPAIDPKKVTYIQEEVGYWRKANSIHQWFVDNCQNGNDECQEAYVDVEKMKELLNLCQAIKENCKLKKGKISHGYTIGADGEEIHNMQDGMIMENPLFAADLLPTQSGFFFGGTEYDEYYMQDIDNTIKIMKDELALIEKHAKDETPLMTEYYYRSSW